MSVHIICGPRFSGKTTLLIQLLKKRHGDDILVIDSSFHTKYSFNATICSHGNEAFKCKSSDNLNINKDLFKSVSTIAIEEGQIFEDIMEVVQQWAAHGKEIIVTGQTNGLFMEPIPHMSSLISCADKITQLHKICSSCTHAEAVFSYRKTALPATNGDIKKNTFYNGGKFDFSALCRRCFGKRLHHDRMGKFGMFSTDSINQLTVPAYIASLDLTLQGKR